MSVQYKCERYKCARCGSLLTVVPDEDGRFAVHPCVRCTPHPALMVEPEDFAALRARVDTLSVRLVALEYAMAPPPMTQTAKCGARPPISTAGPYSVASTPQQVTQTEL